jgi:hypothetical protein
MKITVKEEKEVRYLMLDVAVRYDDEDMPFDAPLRDGKSWKAIIDLNEKRILDWPQGKTLSFHEMKVCDEGLYRLLDETMTTISVIDGYVPNHLLPGSYGDYLSLDIDEKGVITNWLKDPDLSDFEGEKE